MILAWAKVYAYDDNSPSGAPTEVSRRPALLVIGSRSGAVVWAPTGSTMPPLMT